VVRYLQTYFPAVNLINRVGPRFLDRLQERTGAATPDVARAFAVVRVIFDLDPLWELLDRSTDPVSPEVEQYVLQQVQWLTGRASVNVKFEVVGAARR
jgi:glutamate dehydrogenase